MKKTLIALIAFSLILGSVAFARENESNDDRERVPGPSMIHEFKDIVKRGKDLFGHRRNNDQVLVRPEAVACVKTAIDAKDASLKTAISAQATAMNSAIDARSACQKAALDKTTVKEQREANKTCLVTFKASAKAANSDMKKSRLDAWTKYKSDLKTCGQLQKASGGSENIMLEDGQEAAESAS